MCWHGIPCILENAHVYFESERFFSNRTYSAIASFHILPPITFRWVIEVPVRAPRDRKMYQGGRPVST